MPNGNPFSRGMLTKPRAYLEAFLMTGGIAPLHNRLMSEGPPDSLNLKIKRKTFTALVFGVKKRHQFDFISSSITPSATQNPRRVKLTPSPRSTRSPWRTSSHNRSPTSESRSQFVCSWNRLRNIPSARRSCVPMVSKALSRSFNRSL